MSSFQHQPINILGFDHQSLINLLLTLDHTTPIIPPIVISHFLDRVGCSIDDPKVLTMIEAAVRSKLHKIIQIARAHAIANGSVIKSKQLVDCATTIGTTTVLTTESVEFAIAQFAKATSSTVPNYFTMDDASNM